MTQPAELGNKALTWPLNLRTCSSQDEGYERDFGRGGAQAGRQMLQA